MQIYILSIYVVDIIFKEKKYQVGKLKKTCLLIQNGASEMLRMESRQYEKER